MLTAFQIVFSCLVAFFAVKWVYFKILKVAANNRIVDIPDSRKLQKRPVPVLGGVAVFFGLLAGVLAGSSCSFLLTDVPHLSLGPVICAVVIMIYTGALDDVEGLSPGTRFLIEIVTILALIYASGSCIDSFHGLWGIDSFSWWLAVPLTVFSGVGIINAINMIDGVNGLCSGLCIVSSLFFGSMFLKVGEIPNAVMAFSLAAATVPFILHNVFGRKSKMFLGDAGTLMVGLIMTWFTISVLRSDSSMMLFAAQERLNMVAMTLAILSVPVFDTLRVMAQRMYHKRSPFHPDKTHLHHVFVRAGVSHSVTTLLEIMINLVIVLVWAVFAKLHSSLEVQLYAVVISAVLLVWGVYFFFRWHERHHTPFMHRLAKFGIKSHFGQTETWQRLEARLDAPVADLEFEGIDTVEQDRKAVYEFMKGRAEVYVNDMMERCGAGEESVGKILEDGISSGAVKVVLSGSDGLPEIVTLNEE